MSMLAFRRADGKQLWETPVPSDGVEHIYPKNSHASATAVTDGKLIYASFGLDDEEYAVDVRHVREVVNLPSSLMMMPLSPDFVAGVFNLRGAIIPVLNAKRLLRTHQAAQQAGSKIVVVDHGGTRLGLIIDATGRVLRPRGEEQTLFEFGDGSTHSVVAGVLKIGSSLVRVLDLERLMALENVPYPQDGSRSGYASRAKARRRKCKSWSGVKASLLGRP